MIKFGYKQIDRIEDNSLISGRGRFSNDNRFENQSHAQVFRSPYSNGKILNLDISEAIKSEGVLSIITKDDLILNKIGNLPDAVGTKDNTQFDSFVKEQPILAMDHIHYAGQAVAFVVAKTKNQALDACEKIILEVEDNVAACNLYQASKKDSPKVHINSPSNKAFIWSFGEKAKVDAIYNQSKYKVELKIVNNRLCANPMENRNAVGRFIDGNYELYCPTQGVVGMRNTIANNILKIDAKKLRVISHDVGGGFGTRAFTYPEYVLVLMAAKQTKTSVVWQGDRSNDDFVSDLHGRDNISKLAMSFDENYKITSYKIDTLANMGAYLSSFGAFIPTMAPLRVFTGVYDIANFFVNVEGIYTNTAPVDAYRGAGRPEASYALERILSKAAKQLDLKQAELRRINLIKKNQIPYTTATKGVYDSGNFPEVLELAIQQAALDDYNLRSLEYKKSGRLSGIGFSNYMEACGGGGGDQVEFKLKQDGVFEIAVGTQNTGQGHATTFSQIFSEILNIEVDKIKVIQGDSKQVKSSAGTGGSRAVAETGSVVLKGARIILDEGKKFAADIFEANLDDIDITEGDFIIKGTNKKISWSDIYDDLNSKDQQFQKSVEGQNKGFSYTNGCHIAEVSIDIETGICRLEKYTVVDDLGFVINEKLAKGQIQGGVAQGLGQASSELSLYSKEGQLLSGSFMDYAMPKADDFPNIDINFYQEEHCLNNLLGAKGAGEAGSIAAPAAYVNAVLDALSKYTTQIDMPVTSQKIWQAINSSLTN